MSTGACDPPALLACVAVDVDGDSPDQEYRLSSCESVEDPLVEAAEDVLEDLESPYNRPEPLGRGGLEPLVGNRGLDVSATSPRTSKYWRVVASRSSSGVVNAPEGFVFPQSGAMMVLRFTCGGPLTMRTICVVRSRLIREISSM